MVANKVLRALLAALALGSGSCATARTDEGTGVIVVTDADDGAVLWHGTATFVLRPPARVVALPGLGELQVVDGGGRLAWAKDGLARLAVLAGDGGCSATEPRRLCCRAARFAGVIEGRARVVRVDGCADENDLMESRLGGVHEASVGPAVWRRRCAPLPARPRRCEVTYVALRAAWHEGHDDAARGLAFSWDGDGFLACFLERDAGRYRLELLVEDACGGGGPVTLAGDSGELD